MCGIYKITNNINGKIYVGQSICIEKRWRNHKNYFGSGNEDYPLYRAFSKYGIDNFSFEVIEECSRSELNKREIYWINYYNSVNNGYNQSYGTINAQKLTPEYVLKIIDDLKNTNDNTEKIGEKYQVSGRTVRAINTGESWYFDNIEYPIRKKENNYITKICPICKKEFQTDDNRTMYCSLKCVGISQRKVINRPEPLELAKVIIDKGFEEVGRIYGVNGNSIRKWCVGYDIPYIKKDLINWYYSQIGEKLPIKEKKQVKKKVLQIDVQTNQVVAEYESANAAARAFGKKKGNHISEVCNGKLKQAYGFLWKYKE